MKSWTPLAYGLLQDTAKSYGGVVTYLELSDHVQSTSGQRTTMLLMNWIGPMLDLIAKQAHRDSDAPLASLCVKADGTIGDGYLKSIVATTGGEVEDLQWRAAEDRLACYQKYASDLPADGGQPTLTKQAKAKKERVTRKPVAEKTAGEVCPSCFMEKSLTGLCNNCD